MGEKSDTEGHNRFECNKCKKCYVMIVVEDREDILLSVDFKLLDEEADDALAGLTFSNKKTSKSTPKPKQEMLTP